MNFYGIDDFLLTPRQNLLFMFVKGVYVVFYIRASSVRVCQFMSCCRTVTRMKTAGRLTLFLPDHRERGLDQIGKRLPLFTSQPRLLPLA
jgi:hypothetical protein